MKPSKGILYDSFIKSRILDKYRWLQFHPENL